MDQSARRYLENLVVLSCAAVAIVMTPAMSYEPIDQPKLAVLVLCGFSAIGLLLVNVKTIKTYLSFWFLTLLALFILQLSSVILFTSSPLITKLFGTFGRNTGYLCYVCLTALAIASALVANKKFLRKLLYIFLTVGSVSMFYALLQYFHVDPVHWNNVNNSIIGFLGNPDFESAFLGMFAIGLVALLFSKTRNFYMYIIAFGFLSLTLFLIIKSQAQQGILVFGIGTILIFFFFLRSTSILHKKWLMSAYVTLVSCVSFLVIAGTLNHGPLAKYLYKLSVRQRGYYWHAGLKMMFDNPVFGTGLDTYGNYYLKYRSANAAFHTPLTPSNAAHNVFIDFGASGGVILFLLNLAIVLATAIVSIRALLRFSFDWVHVGLFAIWVGYIAQAFVSINQIGNAIWGWVLTGLLVGYSRNRQVNSDDNSTKKRKPRENSTSAFSGLLGLIVGSIIVFPYFIADHNLFVSQQLGNSTKLFNAATQYPKVTERIVNVAAIFFNNHLPVQGQELLDQALKIDPNNYESWALQHEVAASGSKIKELSREKMLKLNPHIPVS